MKSTTTLALLTGFIAGIGGTLLVRPAPRAGDEAATTHVGRATTKSPREDAAALEQGRVAKRWIERIGTDGIGKTLEKIPVGDMEALIEKMMAPMWGSITDEQTGQLVSLISAWAEKEPDEALAWARTRDIPLQRELALTSVAGVVGKTDPMAGFGIYAEIGISTLSVNCDAMDYMMGEVYKTALQNGPDGLIDIARRTPQNGGSGALIVQADYPPAFDFAKLLDALAPMSSPDVPGRFLKAIIPTEPLDVWASRDPEAAFGYVTSRIEEGGKVYIRGFPLKAEWIAEMVLRISGHSRLSPIIRPTP